MSVGSELTPTPQGGPLKMEDRKRHAAHSNDESAPPLKRQATALNGGSRVDREDMPWKDDLERFQKDAIYRQMQEYKRERNDLETQLNERIRKSMYHDDHLRVVDAWWRQLLDEVKILSNEPTIVESSNGSDTTFSSNLLFDKNEKFESHLKAHSSNIKQSISEILGKLPQSKSPEIVSLQEKVAKMLAVEKGHVAEIERLQSEKELVEERLENASWRFMMAEKKLDRAKSATVAKLERQAVFGGSNEAGSGIGGGESTAKVKKEVKEEAVNGDTAGPTGEIHAVDQGRREALALAEKQKTHIEKLEAENDTLTGQVTTMTFKAATLSDEDYAHSDLFKHMKSQYEDVIKRINNLEATNIQLREEAEKLQAERTAYRHQIEVEVQAPVGELENQLARAESDLARIRTARDELGADLAVKKASQEQDQSSHEMMKELASSRENRIQALESEVDRLKLQTDASKDETTIPEDLQALQAEELRSRLTHLQQEYTMISSELPSMATAWKKASALASKKASDSSALEDKIGRLQAEKAKAEQKYFATMKLKESREGEVKTLRAQNSKSSEIVAQLKEVDASTRGLLVNVEKQLAETKEALNSMSTQNRNLQQQINQCNITINGLKNQTSELGNSLKTKDTNLAAATKAQRALELELEQIRVRLEDSEKSLQSWRSKAAGNQSEEFEMLRTLALCTVCRARFKNTALKTCGHVFCKECVEERIASRSRKCPNCSRSYGAADVMIVHM